MGALAATLRRRPLSNTPLEKKLIESAIFAGGKGRISMADEGCNVRISPQLRKAPVTDRDVIQAVGTLEIKIRPESFHGQGFFFDVAAPGYHFQMGMINGALYVIRNEDKLGVSAAGFKGRLHAFLMWHPERLSVAVRDEGNPAPPKMFTLATQPTRPPNALLTWARKTEVIPRTTYENVADLFASVVNGLQGIPELVRETRMQDAFWDASKEGATVRSRKPKSEPQIVPTLHGLLYNLSIAKGWVIQPQQQLGGGLLDFGVQGVLRDGSLSTIPVEFKLAHNPEIERALGVQLPEYMKSLKVDIGVLAVLSLKGRDFEEPKETLDQLQTQLDNVAYRNRLGGIRVLVLDLGRHEPASQL